MSSVNQVYIAVIGAGGVGRHFLSQLSVLSHKVPNISLVLISRSTKSLRASHRTTPLSLETWEKDLEASTSPALTVDQTLKFLQELPDKRVLIDNTSSQDVADAYPAFLNHGISIVTPNKKAFSSTLDLWHSIHESSYRPYDPYLGRGLLYHESSVGAGLPIISTLKDLIDTGDTVRRIEGVFSGTMSFLFNNFAPVDGKGGKWSAEVRKAKEAGFTEPDPRDDLNGVDVARKLVILARLVGLQVQSTESFPVQSLIPVELEGAESGEVFMERLGEFDKQMDEVKNEAVLEGKVVRFVGSVDVGRRALKVGLEKLDKAHPIAGLEGSDNIVSFYTESAGGAVTAMGVTADLIKVIQRVS
ncbi:hypothetical protein HO133_009869 [Letharia lupina]|uniref:Homoserine dehydrogenase n=1 Tax=Letharia lupina TaxID=560253 RepID=A0A8H6CM23_9LECA|nr:uncharacterized protein HO133_009869 [Letharia lupina]KAF6225867.1 hypothetical protein HO133_009869 [Letharia lupina]